MGIDTISQYVSPDFVPSSGVYISANGRVSVFMDDTEYEILRIQRAFIQISNSISGYAQTGSQNVITYSGMTMVSGSISRAFINFMEMRLVTGDSNKIINNTTDFETLMGEKNVKASGMKSVGGNRGGVFDLNRYPPQKMSVGLMINDQIVKGGTKELSKAFMIKANWVLFDNAQVAFDSRNLVRSDGLRFIASYPTYELVSIDETSGGSTAKTA